MSQDTPITHCTRAAARYGTAIGAMAISAAYMFAEAYAHEMPRGPRNMYLLLGIMSVLAAVIAELYRRQAIKDARRIEELMLSGLERRLRRVISDQPTKENQ